MGNGLIYRIPRFQRDYSWGEEEWEDLWSDILEVTNPKTDDSHYMGYLVLQSKDEKSYDVIDGQQRLTTLSIIVLAALRILQKLISEGVYIDNNQRRMDQLRQTYVGYLDPITLVARSKLTLNRNNDNYYQSYIVPLRDLPARGFRASEHSMRKASDWFERRLHLLARERAGGSGDVGIELAKVVEGVSDRLFFTVITVTDELNAYKVFETLNSRGVRLSATDLLKNYLFSVLHREGGGEADLEAMEARWGNLVGRLGEENFPDYLRVHWISRNGLVRHTDLYKTIRTRVADRQTVFNLLQGLDDDLDTYLSMLYPETSGWSGDAKRYASLLRMFSVRQHLSTIIAAKRIFGDQDFERLLKVVVNISFRYNVIGRMQASEQERVYANVAQRISRGEYPDARSIIEALRPIYLTDRAFKTAFAEIEINTSQSRNRRIVRYILTRLERQVSGHEYDRDAESFNIEHVLPQNPPQGWSFTDAEAQSTTYRLGNMTLLRSDENRELDNSNYASKTPVLAGSAFQITADIPKSFVDWNIEAVARRQSGMANLASGIWREPSFD